MGAMSAFMKKTAFSLSPRKSIAQLIIIGALAACSTGSGDPMQDAAAAIEEQDYRSARIHLMTALRENAQDPKANLMFAKTLIELGDGVGAETALQKIIGNPEYAAQAKPLLGRAKLLIDQPEAALELASEPAGQFAAELSAVKALALFDLGRFDEGDAVIAEAIASAPGNAELQWIKGNRQLDIGDLDGATRSANAAMKAAPDAMEAMLLAGRISLAKADGQKALQYFEKIRKMRPDNAVAEYLTGAIFRDFGKREEARHCFNNVLNISPRHPWATYFLARMDYEDGKADAAFERFNTTKADIGEVPQALRLAGILDVQRGNYEQAIDRLNRFLAQNPPDAEALVALSKALAGAGNHAEAYGAIQPLVQSVTAPADALELAVDLAGKSGSASAQQYAQRSAALDREADKNAIFEAEQAIIAQDWVDAAKIYNKLLKQNHPQKVMLLNNAAMVHFNLAKADQALKYAEQAHKIAPDDPMVKDTLGWILLQTRKDKARALALLQEAAAAAPNNPEIIWHLANALAANGQKAEARELAVKLEPVAGPAQKTQIKNLLAWI